MTDQLVWSFGFREEAGFIIDRIHLDGDPRKIGYVDTTRDEGRNALFEQGRLYAGRPVRPDHIPTRIQWSSKRYPPYDVFMSRGIIHVSDAFKDIVEHLEPGVHQFFPIEAIYKDGSFARQMYFFNICHRLDAVDRERATVQMRKIAWDSLTGEFAFSLDKIGGAHAWIDKRINPGRFLSNAVVTEIKKAGLTGIVPHSYPAC